MDICLYISDQHAYEVQGYADNKIIRTPNLDRIAKEGTAFMNAYTPYPVCVPARMSMLSGQYASKNGVMGNHGSLNSNVVTFMHCLDTSSYETVLCGRMHFIGGDQRHGFTRRIAGDITQVYNNRPARIGEERGVHNKTPQGGASSVSLVGAGNSPVLEYDRYVIDKALEYLRHDYEKPQFLCVGTYAPHHPFVAPKEKFDYYYDKVEIPEESFGLNEHPALALQFKDEDRELIRAVRAAYYGMVEFEDEQIGKVYDAFNEYLKRNKREGVFIYVSDHGEHEGYRGLYGKNTFYESSVHIPMLFAGTGVGKGIKKYGPVSLMDVGETINELAGAVQYPIHDGVSLCDELHSDKDDRERIVLSELGGEIMMGSFSYGQMAVWKNFKYIHYDGYDHDDILFDLEKDPLESINVIEKHPEITERFKKEIAEKLDVEIEQLKQRALIEKKYVSVLSKGDYDSEELWHCPEEARHLPDPCFSSKITLEDWIAQIKAAQNKK